MSNKNQFKKAGFLALSVILFAQSCKDEPAPPSQPVDETELITTVRLQFEDSASGAKTYALFSDPDGEGGKGPVQFDSIKLKSNSSYTTRILLLDESKTPVDTISNEVLKESDEHLFVFTPEGVNLKVSLLDKDKNNLPVGLLSAWRTGSAGKGRVKVTLRHQPNVKDGTATPGETDVEVDFPCSLQ